MGNHKWNFTISRSLLEQGRESRSRTYGHWNRSTNIDINIDIIKYIAIICVMCYNTTAIAYINHMAGIKSKQCNRTAVRIWEFYFMGSSMFRQIEADGQSIILFDDTDETRSWLLRLFWRTLNNLTYIFCHQQSINK